MVAEFLDLGKNLKIYDLKVSRIFQPIKDKLVKRHSIMALGIMSSVPKVRDHLAKTKDGFIEDCTNLLADEDQIVAEFAVNMLANISQGIF